MNREEPKLRNEEITEENVPVRETKTKRDYSNLPGKKKRRGQVSRTHATDETLLGEVSRLRRENAQLKFKEDAIRGIAGTINQLQDDIQRLEKEINALQLENAALKEGNNDDKVS